MKLTNLHKLMNYLFGKNEWDTGSPAYNFFRKYSNRQNTSLVNLKRRAKIIINNNK